MQVFKAFRHQREAFSFVYGTLEDHTCLPDGTEYPGLWTDVS